VLGNPGIRISNRFGIARATAYVLAGRRIAHPAATGERLRRHRKRQNDVTLAVAPASADHDLVFATPNGSPIYPHSLSRAFAWRIAESGVKKIRFHDLRCTCATLISARGEPPSQRRGERGQRRSWRWTAAPSYGAARGCSVRASGAALRTRKSRTAASRHRRRRRGIGINFNRNITSHD
jgi:hypothetical protein